MAFKNSELKQTKIWKHHCKKCGLQIRGNGTVEEPYCCGCGVWVYNFKTQEYEV